MLEGRFPPLKRLTLLGVRLALQVLYAPLELVMTEQTTKIQSSQNLVSAAGPKPQRFAHNSFQALFEGLPLETDADSSGSSGGEPVPAGVTASQPQATSVTSVHVAGLVSSTAFSTPGGIGTATNQPNQAQGQQDAPATTGNGSGEVSATSVPSVPGLDLSEYSVASTVHSLAPLLDAIKKAGINPAELQFDQLEAYEAFPGRADLSFTDRQILIRSAKGAQLFDLNLALRTPWVTAAELRSYGLV